MDTGRWTILSRATPRPRRPSQPYLRARVNVRCVCGYEATIWLEDIEQERSTGCASRVCRARWLARDDIRELLTDWTREIAELVQEYRGDPRDLHGRLEQLCVARTSAIEDAITVWLRSSELEAGARCHGA